MDWFFSKRKAQKFREEVKQIDAEISRSKRAGNRFGVLTVEISHSVPRGLSRFFPGRTISFHVLEKQLRLYDRVMESQSRRRYYIILPATDENGVDAVKKRIILLAQAEQWGDVSVDSVIYPDDGHNSKALLDKFSKLEGGE